VAGQPLVRVAIDLGFDALMTPREARSLASQVAAAHGANVRAEVPCELLVAGAARGTQAGDALARFDTLHWRRRDPHGARVRPEALEALPAGERRALVYLSPDARDELAGPLLAGDVTYVIGGLVDRNRHARASATRAAALGARTARLPLESAGVATAGAPVLTVAHTVHALLAVAAGRPWADALRAALPPRRRAAP